MSIPPPCDINSVSIPPPVPYWGRWGLTLIGALVCWLSSQLPLNMSMPLLQSGTLTQKFVVVPALRITFDLPSVTPTNTM